MSQAYAYDMSQPLAIRAAQSERAAFIRRTYLHLAGAILAFVGLQYLIFTLVPFEQLQGFIGSIFGSTVSQLIVFGAFIGVGYLARWWAYNGGSQTLAYAGLALYVVAQAVLILP